MKKSKQVAETRVELLPLYRKTSRVAKKINRVKGAVFSGRAYRVLWVKIKDPDCYGLTYSPGTPGRSIRFDVAKCKSDSEMLRVAIDEGIHACDYGLANAKVAKISESLAEFLYDLGFRLSKSKKPCRKRKCLLGSKHEPSRKNDSKKW